MNANANDCFEYKCSSCGHEFVILEWDPEILEDGVDVSTVPCSKCGATSILEK